MQCLLLYSLIWIISSGLACGSVLDKIKSVGCYDLGYSLRKNFHNHLGSVTLEKCVDFCCERKTKYAGIEQSDNFCYCGGDIAEESIKREDSSCNVHCTDQSDMYCGGDWLMSLYDISASCGDGCTQSSDGQVRFLVAMNIGVRLYKGECSNDYDLLHTSNEWTHSVDYHYAKNLLFYSINKQLYKTTFQTVSSTSAASSLVLIRNLTSCDAFAVDWVADRIYWPDCINNAIMSMDLDGTGVTTLVDRPEEPGTIKRMEVDPYKGMLFWTNDGVIESCQLEGDANFRTDVSRPGAVVRALSLDMAARRVYYVGMADSKASLFSMNYQGGDQREVFSMPEVMSVYGIGFLKDNVYWVNHASSQDVLYKSSLTDAETLQISTPFERAVWHMKVVHPSIQQRPNVTANPCDDKLCAHDCVVESPTVATCLCPDDQMLDTDGITCISMTKGVSSARLAESVSVGALLVGILLVMVIVMISGLLVYLGDKYWSHLHMKLTGTPYARKRDSFTEDESNYHAKTTFNTTEDNVILVP